MRLDNLEKEQRLYQHEQSVKEEDSFSFGLLSLQMYAAIKADDVYRSYRIGQSAIATGTNAPSYVNFGVPFFDGKFGSKAPNPDKIFGFSRSFSTVGDGTPIGKYGVEMASHYNNTNIIDDFKKVGAYSDDEIKILKEFIETKPDKRVFKSTQKAVDETVHTMDNFVDDLIGQKSKNYVKPLTGKMADVADDAIGGLTGKEKVAKLREILLKKGDDGVHILEGLKGTPHASFKKGVGVSMNMTKFISKSPKLARFVGLGAKAFSVWGWADLAYQVGKSVGDYNIAAYENSSREVAYKRSKTTRESGLTYSQQASFHQETLSARVNADSSLQYDRQLVETAIATGRNVNEFLRVSLGGTSDLLGVNKVRKTGL